MDNKHWRVLIIDDSPDDRAELQCALLNGSTRGFSFDQAETGREGILRIKESASEPYDCVLLDYHLPDMDAPEILAELFPTGTASFPVVVVTGVTTPKTAHDVICSGAQDLMGKGWINPESLTRTVGNAVERYKLIAEGRKLEQALFSSETRLRNIFESSGDAIVLLGYEGFVECNLASLDLFGCENEKEFLGKQPWDFSPRFQPNGQLSDVLAAENLTLVQRHGYHRFEWQHRRQDGSKFDAEIVLTLLDLPDGPLIQAILRDITDRKAIENKLKESESRFRVLFESSDNAIALLDQNGYFESNAACLSLFGCTSKQDFLGRSPGHFSPTNQPDGHDSAALAVEQIKMAYQTGKNCFEWRHQRIDGTEFDAEITLILIELDGRLVIHATIRDITQRKQISLALAAAKDQAILANEAKSMFLANMSHEIRTPISAVIGLTNLCLGETSLEKTHNYLVKIEKASETLLQLINDILDFSKVEANKLTLSEAPFELATMFENLASIFGTQAEDKGLDLIFPPSCELQSVFVGDSQRLLQVLINLVSNAIKFTAKGRVTVEVVEESRCEGKAVLRFTVRDQGIGMTSETLTTLFQPFVQGDNTTTRHYGGTGLGLALSKRLIEMMGGSIGAESKLGQGSCFYFTACVGIGDDLNVETGLARTQAVDDNQRDFLKDRDILVAEDSEFNQILIVDVLKNAGFRVRLVETGTAAIGAVEESRPDAVLMDCQMPVMDGYQATRLLRLQPAYRSLPIIALTANALQGDREKCLEAGMNDFLTKPVRLEELMSVLARWIKPKQKADSEVITDSSMAEVEFPGIDTTQGLNYLRGSWPMYLKLLTMFRDKRLLGFNTQYRETLHRKAWDEASRLAHNLKTEAKTIGATRLGDLAERLELVVVTLDVTMIEPTLAPVEREVELILSGLNKLDSNDH